MLSSCALGRTLLSGGEKGKEKKENYATSSAGFCLLKSQHAAGSWLKLHSAFTRFISGKCVTMQKVGCRIILSWAECVAIHCKNILQCGMLSQVIRFISSTHPLPPAHFMYIWIIHTVLCSQRKLCLTDLHVGVKLEYFLC